MKVKWKKYLAFILAIALVVSSGVFSSDRYLKATDGEDEVVEEVASTEEAVAEESAEAAAELAIAEAADSGEETGVVEEVTPAEAPAEEAAPAEEPQAEAPAEEAPAEETPAEEAPAEASVEEPQAETPAEEPQAEEAEAKADNAEEVATDEETTVSEETEGAAEAETEEAAEEETEETETEDEDMPAATVKVTASNGAVVTVDAPKGALPKGFTVEVTVLSGADLDAIITAQLEAAGVELLSYTAYDVTIYDKKGKEIQPDDRVKVTIGSATSEGDYQAVYHISDEGVVDRTNEFSGSTASIELDHFSPVVVVDGLKAADSDAYITGTSEIFVGDTTKLTTHITGNNYNGSWSSSDSTIASVSSGTVTGKKAGTATISYTYYTSRSGFIIYSYSNPHTIEYSVTVSEASITGPTEVNLGDTIELTANAPSGGTWSSSDTKKATVTSSGVVTGVKKGDVTIKYQYGSGSNKKTLEHKITVTEYTVTISGPTSVDVGNTIELSADIKGGTWTVESGADKADVDEESGIVTGLKEGTAKIKYTVTSNGKNYSATYDITVTKARTIVFKYYKGNPNDSVSASDMNAVKFCVLLVDEDGTQTYYNGDVADITINASTVAINASTFASVDVEGYSFAKAYAYFPWYGSDVTNESSFAPVSMFRNFGAKSPRMSYNSYIGFLSSFGTGNDFSTSTDAAGYYAYNPTGTLRLVFYKVTANTPNTNYVVDSSTTLKEKDTTMWKNGGFTYYPKDMTSTYTASYMEAAYPNNGAFEGWYTDSGCNNAVTSAFFDAAVTSDVNLYAKWNTEKEYAYTVNYYLNGTTDALLESTTGSAVWKSTATVEAPAIDGYTPVASTGSVKITKTEANNVINLYYYKNITITAESDTKDFDGTEKSVSGYAITDGEISGYALGSLTGITAGTKGTNAGTYTATFSENPVGKVTSTGYYIVAAAVDGTLTINPKAVTVYISGETAEKPYSGQVQSVEGWNMTSASDSGYIKANIGLADGVSAVASGTDAGSYNMGLTAESFVNNNTNYIATFVVTDGKLEINKISGVTVTIVGAHVTETYDGTEKTATGIVEAETVISGSNIYTAADFTFAEGVVAEAKGTHYGTYNMGLTPASFVNTNANFKDVTFVVTDGYVEITKRPITIQSATASQKYNGKALTDSTVTVEDGTSFVAGEGFTYNVTGTQTEVGSSANTFTYEADENTSLDDYEVTKREGTLTVSENDGVVVTITEKSGNATYDGTEKTVTGYDVSISDSSYDESDFTFSGTAEIKGTTAGTYNMELKPSDFANTNSNFKDVQFVIVDGSLVISPITATLTITADTDSKVYDGEALTAGATYTDGVLVDGDVLTYEVSGSITDAGTETSTVTSYSIKRGDVDVTDCYENITKVDGTLAVTKRPVKVTSATDSKEYDGTALVNAGYTIAEATDDTGLIEGDTILVSVTGSQTDVGSSANTLTVEAGTANLENYNVTTTPGTLTVSANTARIVIKAADGSKQYDGTALTADGYEVTEGRSELPQGATIEATVAGSITDFGTADNTITALKVMLGEKDITGFYTGIETALGTLTVTKAPLTIKSKSANKPYDGTPLTANEVEIISGQLYAGATLSATTNASVTYVSEGTVPNTYTYEIQNGNASNYEVTAQTGELYITAKTTPIVLTAGSATKTYDGSALTEPSYTYTEGVLAEGDVLTATVEGTITNVAVTEDGSVTSVPNTVTDWTVTRTVGEETIDVTDCYTFGDSVDGTLTVNKRSVTIKSADGSKTYDGTALTKNNPETDITIDGDGFADGEGATYEITGTITDAGTAENEFTYTLNDNTKETNYEISTEYGTLAIAEVDEVVVTVTGASATKTYNGKEQTVSGYTFTTSDPLYTDADFTFSGNDSVSAADFGTYEMGLKEADFVNTNNNFKKVTFVIHDGSLEIEKLGVITVTASSASKVYDGSALTAGYTYSGTLAEGHTLEAEVEGEITDYVENGVTNTVKSYKVKDAAGNDVTKNYTFGESVDGTLTITKRPVEIATEDAEKQYDGTALTNGEYTITETNDETKVGFVGTDSVTVNVTGTITDVGTVANAFTVTADGTTNLDNYSITETPGTLTVNANTAKLIITADGGSKTYDGTALTVGTAKVTTGSIPTGAEVIATNNGSQTNAGSSSNEIAEYSIKLGDKDITAFYTNVETKAGTLTVNPRDIVIVSNNAEKTYDGTALTETGFTLAEGTAFVDGEGITITDSASITNKGVKDNTFTYAANEGTNLANYSIAERYGTLTVNARNVKLTSATDSKTYDSLPLSNSNVTVDGDGFVDGEGVTYDFTGSEITDAGTKTNAFTYTFNEGTDANNYVVSTAFGTLTVSASAEHVIVTITAANLETTYDGTDKVLSGYTTSITNDLYTEADFTYTGTDSITEKDAGTYTFDLEEGKFTNTNPNFSDVEFVVKDGELKINKRSVEVTSNGGTKEYDGLPLTVNAQTDVSVTSELGFVDGETPTYDITGTITDITPGGVDNVFTWTFPNGVNAENYIVSPVYGKLYITKVTTPITITAKSSSKVYDGEELEASGFEFTQGILATGDILTANVTGTIGPDVSTGTSRVASYKVTRAADGADVTAFYTFAESNDGTLEIERRPVTLTSGSLSKIYDGTELKNEVVTPSSGDNEGFVGTDTATYANFTSQTLVTDASGVDNLFDYTFVGANEGNYNITKKYGKLIVYDRTVKFEADITANGGTFEYNGVDHTVDGFVGETANGVPVTAKADDGTVVTYYVTGLATSTTVRNVADSTTTEITGTAVVKDAAGNDVTSQFIVTAHPANVTVTKRNIKFTSDTHTWEYDGEDHKAENVTIGGEFVDGEGATFTFGDDVKVKYAGETKPNTFTYALDDGTEANNYNISTEYGQIAVVNRSDDAKYIINVKAKSGNYTYNGQPRTVSGLETYEFEAANGATYTVSGLTAEATLTNAGSTSVNVEGIAVVKDASGQDVTGSFIVNATPGTLTIDKRKVKITSGSGEKEYDGYSLEVNEVEYSEGGFVGDDYAIITYTGSQLLVGMSENFFTYELAEGVIAENYDISTEYGTLNVINRDAKFEITMTANSDEVVYDGSEKTVEGFETTEFVINDNTYTVSGVEAKASGTEAGTYNTAITGVAIVTDAAGNDVTDQFAVHVVGGTLTIKGVYTLTINYVDAAGTKLADSYVANYVEGETFGPINSPEVEGYTPQFRAIYSDEDGMPARDVEIDVLYTANKADDEDDDDNGGGNEEDDDNKQTDDDDTGKDGVEPNVDDETNDNGRDGVEPTADDSTPQPTGDDSTPQLTIPVADQTPTGDGDDDDNTNGDGTTVSDEQPPAGELTIDVDGNPTITQLGEEDVPLGANVELVWALLNLLAAIFTALICLMLLVTYFTKKKEDDERINNRDGEVMDEDVEDEIKRRGFLRLFSIVPALVSVIIFVLTQDMTKTMVLTDKWTLCMVIILILQVILAFFARKKIVEKDKNTTEAGA